MILKRLLTALIGLCFLATSSWAAGMWVYESGAWKSVPLPSIYEGGTYHAVNQGWVYESGAWHLFFTSLAVSASDVSGLANTNLGACTVVTSGAPGTTVTGGSGSFTYSWTYVSGDATTVSSSTAQNPTWSQSLCTFSGGDAQANAVWHVLVTDTVTLSTVGTNINVHLEYNRP